MPLPTFSDVHRAGFSAARYGKQYYAGAAADAGAARRVLEDDEDDEDAREVYGYSARAARSAPRRLDGALERMARMPVDILYEIFSHLHPTDVLSLARASRGLRALLTAPHAGGVWRAALGSVRALPACPPDMAPMQYASLAFDDWCHFCLAPGIKDVAWVCRVRCCQKCLRHQFISEDELDLCLPEAVYLEQPASIFPFCALPDKRAAGRNQPMYFLPRAREYLRELAALEDDAALAAWSREKKERQALRVQHAARCEYWRTHWGFRPAPRARAAACLWELALVLWLSVLLAGLWKDRVAQLVGGAARG